MSLPLMSRDVQDYHCGLAGWTGFVELSAVDKLDPALPDVYCRKAKTSSSWQASSRSVKSQKKVPKPGGHT